jgi:hypothetical protein
MGKYLFINKSRALFAQEPDIWYRPIPSTPEHRDPYRRRPQRCALDEQARLITTCSTNIHWSLPCCFSHPEHYEGLAASCPSRRLLLKERHRWPADHVATRCQGASSAAAGERQRIAMPASQASAKTVLRALRAPGAGSPEARGML